MKKFAAASTVAALLLCLFSVVTLAGRAAAAGAAPALPAPAVSETAPSNAPRTVATPRLHGTPYITDVTPTSAVVNWLVRVGPVGLGESPEAMTARYGWRVERAPLTALKPATRYYYDVLGDGTAEGRGDFVTAPDKSTDFTFDVYGDTRTRDDVHRAVVAKIAGDNPSFVLHTGDLVTDGRRGELWPRFFDISDPLLRHTAFFPTLGNHERNTPFFHECFARNPVYYSFNWGNVHVAMINSDVNNVAPSSEGREQFWKDQLEWLAKDLAGAQQSDFRFVAMHHTPYTAMSSRQHDADQLRARLMPLLRKYSVQAVFSGHDHNYQHHRSDGIEFIVTGGGGAPLYALDAPIAGVTVKTEKTENFVRAHVTGRECTLQAVALDGHLIDTVQIVAPKHN